MGPMLAPWTLLLRIPSFYNVRQLRSIHEKYLGMANTRMQMEAVCLLCWKTEELIINTIYQLDILSFEWLYAFRVFTRSCACPGLCWCYRRGQTFFFQASEVTQYFVFLYELLITARFTEHVKVLIISHINLISALTAHYLEIQSIRGALLAIS